MEENTKYLELSEIVKKLEDIGRVMDFRSEFYKDNFTIKGGNITVTAPRVFDAFRMFVSAYENFNKPNKLEKLIEEVTIAKDSMLETIAGLEKPEYYRGMKNQLAKQFEVKGDN